MVIHERFAFECGGFLDIKRKPLAEMSMQGKQQLILTLEHIKKLIELQYQYQLLDEKLEEMSKRDVNSK